MYCEIPYEIMIRIVAVGKTRQSFVKEGIAEFVGRLEKYTKIEYKEVEKVGVLQGYVIALDEHGTQYTSPDFSKKIQRLTMNHKDLTFVIGPAEGIPKDVLSQCQDKVSLSLMTFPTQLVRLIFVEQLYRAFTIMNNEPYHKD
ncbi:23S rRNA (pseudouridine(1915)-N(3))-methyltransferase RlmH [Candidatus Woesearchaeota archaeon]|nr:23S rRNA (pseudouridine(1915)-N(3))-methyltransferase RlmH [Candidatus Woesearchaeota archaeon]